MLWQISTGWPTLQFWSQYGSEHTTGISPAGFLFEQIYTMNPLTLPLWLAGLYFYLRLPEGKPYRLLGWTFVILYVLFTLAHAKSYFLAPAYPMLYAGGALVAERIARSKHWLRVIYVALLAASAILLAPIALPLLPPRTFAHIYGILGGDAGAKMEQHATGVLPQWLADRFGWPTMTATVARVYRQLPPADRVRTCIYTLNYGEAGAIDFFGPRYGLPHAISGHNTYYLWGPDACTGTVLITVGIPREGLSAFSSVTRAATITCNYCMPEEDNLPVYVARRLRIPLKEAWAQAKHYN